MMDAMKTMSSIIIFRPSQYSERSGNFGSHSGFSDFALLINPFESSRVEDFTLGGFSRAASLL